MSAPAPDPEGDAMAAQYAAELRHENALKYAERVFVSPETFHEDEVLLANAVMVLRAQIKRWMDDYYRMNSLHERAAQHQQALARALQSMVKVYWPKNADGTYGDGLPDPIVIKEARAALQAAGVEDVP